MLTLCIILFAGFAVLGYTQRRRLVEARALAKRLQNFLNEIHEIRAGDNAAWERRVKEMRDRMAVIDLNANVVYGGPDALPPGFEEESHMAFSVVRLERWEDLPVE